MRIIESLSVPTGTLRVTKKGDGNFELKVTFANGRQKTAIVTADQLRQLKHSKAKLRTPGVNMHRDTWDSGRKSGPKPHCVYMSFPGEGPDLIVVPLRALTAATGVRP